MQITRNHEDSTGYLGKKGIVILTILFQLMKSVMRLFLATSNVGNLLIYIITGQIKLKSVEGRPTGQQLAQTVRALVSLVSAIVSVDET